MTPQSPASKRNSPRDLVIGRMNGAARYGGTAGRVVLPGSAAPPDDRAGQDTADAGMALAAGAGRAVETGPVTGVPPAAGGSGGGGGGGVVDALPCPECGEEPFDRRHGPRGVRAGGDTSQRTRRCQAKGGHSGAGPVCVPQHAEPVVGRDAVTADAGRDTDFRHVREHPRGGPPPVDTPAQIVGGPVRFARVRGRIGESHGVAPVRDRCRRSSAAIAQRCVDQPDARTPDLGRYVLSLGIPARPGCPAGGPGIGVIQRERGGPAALSIHPAPRTPGRSPGHLDGEQQPATSRHQCRLPARTRQEPGKNEGIGSRALTYRRSRARSSGTAARLRAGRGRRCRHGLRRVTGTNLYPGLHPVPLSHPLGAPAQKRVHQ